MLEVAESRKVPRKLLYSVILQLQRIESNNSVKSSVIQIHEAVAGQIKATEACQVPHILRYLLHGHVGQPEFV